MNEVWLMWAGYPDSEIVSVSAHGLNHAQLRHYATRVGWLDFQTEDGEPILIGTAGQKTDLVAILESAGYDVTGEPIIPAYRETSQ